MKTSQQLRAIEIIAADQYPELQVPLQASLNDEKACLKIIKIRSDSIHRRALFKQRHDLDGALRTLELCVESLAAGYRFEDARADAKIKALEKAVRVLKDETEWMRELITVD